MMQDPWDRCAGWLAAALEQGGWTHGIRDVRTGCVEGRYQFWPGERAAVVTELIAYPRLLTCNLWLAGGEMAEILEAIEPRIVAWAAANGVRRMVVAGGRRGWERVLRGRGYGRPQVMLSREIGQ